MTRRLLLLLVFVIFARYFVTRYRAEWAPGQWRDDEPTSEEWLQANTAGAPDWLTCRLRASAIVSSVAIEHPEWTPEQRAALEADLLGVTIPLWQRPREAA